MDTARFWDDDKASHGKPFSIDKPQVLLGIRMPATCIFAELGLSMPPRPTRRSPTRIRSTRRCGSPTTTAPRN
ncbi:MAG: hypothetical protein M5U09_19335 [Gammaproteobacteria bacterium]|nr:hypothetical protein [Gammaproteobacteria bacterium]